MRIIFGVLSLLIVVAVLGTLAKKQLTGVSAMDPASAPGGNAQQQSQQIQQQVKQSLDAAMQQARPPAEDK
ncbi:MAG: hypothetical protein PSV24_06160 [Rhodoferax sp.]|nr:hypothetical protein [Rhodoferax sp.]